MKNYLKGLVSGIILAAAILCIPVVANNISVTFNEFRINIDGCDKAQWGENYILDNGEEVPYSIVYKDTTYLPIRKISELTGLHIAYNGDSNTVSVANKPQNEKVVAEKPDANGNVWKYYTFTTENSDKYLGIADETRGYERIYKIMSDSDVTVTDDALYFFKENRGEDPYEVDGYAKIGSFQKIEFSSNPDTQDGEEILKLNSSAVAFDGEYVYYISYFKTLNPSVYFNTYNIFTGESEKCYMGRGVIIESLSLDSSGTPNLTTVYGYPPSTRAIYYDYIYDKATNELNLQNERYEGYKQ